MARASNGELTTPELELFQRRGRFLEEIDALFACLQHLRDDVLPAYLQATNLQAEFRNQTTQDGVRRNLTMPTPLTWTVLQAAGRHDGRFLPHLLPLCTAISIWAEKFFLTPVYFQRLPNFPEHVPPNHICRDDWAMNSAITTLESWQRSKPSSELSWQHPPLYGFNPPMVSDSPPPPTYDPRFESDESFSKRMESWQRQVRLRFKADGWAPPSEKRNLEHFAWLALRHVGKFSPHHIAEAVNIEVYPLRRILNQLATEMGLRLRPGKPGRRGKGNAETMKMEITALLSKAGNRHLS